MLGGGRGPHTFVTHSSFTGTHGRYVKLETEDDATQWMSDVEDQCVITL